jgi:hypothetical protein
MSSDYIYIYIYIYIDKFTIVTSPNPSVSERLKLSVAFLCHLPSVTSGSELDLRNFGKKIKYDLCSIHILYA